MRILLALLAALAFGAPAHAQPAYTQAELDALLAPIALQPDGVVSQVLIAATYPEEVAAAAAWSRANAHLRGDAAVRAVEREPWDPAVKALVAFPELLARMDESPQWLHDLGEAFLVQEPQVMATVQDLRRRAQANGQLATSPDTAVYHQGEAIVVQPRTEVVYVRYYDPYVVYGPWWWGPHYRPVVWRPWHPYPTVLARGFFYTYPDWHHRHVRVIHRPVHVHRHHHVHVEPGRWHHRHRHHQHRAISRVETHSYQRVPESQRRPIVQSHQPMPAANGFSETRKREIAREHQRREHRAAEPRREHRAQEHRGRSEHRGRAENRGRGEQRGQRG